MDTGVTQKRSRFPGLLAGLLFCAACVMQAVDGYVRIPELSTLVSLAAQFIFFGILVYWTVLLVSRVSVRNFRAGLTVVTCLMGLMLFIRLFKYFIFHDETVIRYLWYAYYIPLCLAPTTLFLTLLGTAQKSEKPLAKPWYLMLVPAVALVALVFTNDLHRFVFSFPKGLEFANMIYTWGPGYFLILLWIAGLYVGCGILMYVKCRISHCRKKAWLPLALFILCFGISLACAKWDIPYLRMPEAITFSVVIVCESLLRIGFVPTNVDYAKFFDTADISASIADKDLHIALRSKNAPALTQAQVQAAADSGKILLSEDTVLRAKPIRGGEVYWTEDLSVINRINGELAETNQTLSEEGDLIAAENKLKEQRSKIEEQNKLYRGIFSVFRPHLQKIKAAFAKANTEEEKDKALRMAVVYGVYLKRRSNLAMLAKDGEARFSELLYCVRESTDALSFYGAASSVVCEGEGVYPIGHITLLYEFFEACIEHALPGLSACFVRLQAKGTGLFCRVALDRATGHLQADWCEQERSKAGATLSVEEQDETLYVTLSLGGEEARV